MADWMMKSAALFKPLYDLLHQHLLTQEVIHADETTLKVINDERVKSYRWRGWAKYRTSISRFAQYSTVRLSRR
jgi:hypothetical protein